LKDHIYHFDKLVIGGSVESLLYCFINELPVVIKNPLVPFELERVESLHDLSFLGYKTKREVYSSEIWDRLSFLLSMSGFVLLPNIIKNIRQEDNTIIAITENNDKLRVTADKMITFDTIDKDRLYIYDWFDVRSGSVHEYDYLEDKESSFVNKLIFYQSRRIGQNKNRKDVVAVSSVKADNLLDYQNSEGYARLKTLKMMKEAGIRGTSNGFDRNGYKLHYSVKVEHSNREVKNHYTPMYDVFEMLTTKRKKGKLWNLAQRLFLRDQTIISQG
jgi:hypothetical protein